MPESRIAVYPGTFDPPTMGHLDIIGRGLRVVDRLVVGVAINAGKAPMFELEERVTLIRQAIVERDNGAAERVLVKPFGNLLMHFTLSVGAGIILRGLRAVSDFEYEFQMAGMNARLEPKVETVFLMASDKHQFISSRLVKEIFLLGGDVSAFVPPNVVTRLDQWRESTRQTGGVV